MKRRPHRGRRQVAGRKPCRGLSPRCRRGSGQRDRHGAGSPVRTDRRGRPPTSLCSARRGRRERVVRSVLTGEVDRRHALCSGQRASTPGQRRWVRRGRRAAGSRRRTPGRRWLTSRMEPAWVQAPTPMTATAMTARMPTSRPPRRGAGRLRGVVAVICVATSCSLIGPPAAASAARWQGHDPAGRSTRRRRRLYLASMRSPHSIGACGCDDGRWAVVSPSRAARVVRRAVRRSARARCGSPPWFDRPEAGLVETWYRIPDSNR